MFKRCNPSIAVLLLLLTTVIFSTSCRKTEDVPAPEAVSGELEIVDDADPSIWTITAGDSIYIYRLPSGDLIHSGTSDEILAVWARGMLTKSDGTFEWKDLDLETGEYSPVDGIELTSWNLPVAVDPEERIVYAFEHTVPPSRVINAYRLNGREPVQTASLAAEEIELLDPLPVNGWPVFYVDRPSQEGAISPSDEPTRKLRVYSGRYIGGEFPNVTDVVTLSEDVAIYREDAGWLLFEEFGGMVQQRTMSLGQIEGNPRPLARDGNEILVASEMSSSEGSKLYSYGAYTREVSEMPGPSQTSEPGELLALTVKETGEYYAVVGILPEMRTLVLMRFTSDRWIEHARISFDEEITFTEIFFLERGDPAFTGPLGELIEHERAGNSDDSGRGSTDDYTNESSHGPSIISGG